MIQHRWLWFTIAMLLLAIAWPISEKLSLDRSLERMFPSTDSDRIEFQQIEQQFGVSDFLVFAYRDANLWEQDGSGIDRAMEWRKRIEQIPGVAYALDLSRVDQMLASLKGPASFFDTLSGTKTKRPLLDLNNELAKQYRELFTGQTHAANTDLVAIGVLLEPSESRLQKTYEPLSELRKLADGAPGGLLVGHVAMVDEGFREIEADGNRLGIYSTISLTALMLIGFRSLRWAVIVVFVVQWSLIVTRAILVLLNWELTMVSSMLSSIVMVVGVATTLHWMFGYQKEFETGANDSDPRKRAESALLASINRLWQPILWAVITDAIGFASLALSRVGPVQDYGCMMAIACTVVLMGIFWIVPTLALLPLGRLPTSDKSGYSLGSVPGEERIQSVLLRVLEIASTNHKKLIAAACILMLLGLVGSSGLKVETDFLKNFQKNSPIAKAYQAVETELGGAGIWDIMIPAPTPITEEYLDRVLEMEKELLAIEVPPKAPGSEPLRLTSALSLADTDRVARSSAVLRMIPIEARFLGMKQSMGSFFGTLLCQTPSGRSMRVMLRSQERSESEQKLELIDQVRRVVEKHRARLGSRNPQDTAVTGYYVLLTKLVENVVEDQWISFFVAAVGISFAMAIALRSIKYALVAIIPAILPSLVVLGVLGALGIRMNLGVAMIAAVSMGLGVDSSLHYLFRYRQELQERNNDASPTVPTSDSTLKTDQRMLDGLRASQGQTGMAVLMATLAIVVGFGSMAVSNFLPTVAFGTLAAWTMIGGLIGNLCLLPALITWLDQSY